MAARGYAVKLGTGTREANIRDSNAFGALIHIPIHSNAGASSSDCGSTDGGTLVMHYGGPGDDQLARIMAAEVGAKSPGTRDGTAVGRDLADFHTYDKDAEFLRNPGAWGYTFAQAVDRCRGFPRNGPTPTRPKECTW